MKGKKAEVTRILNNISATSRSEDLYPLVYDNLHEIAEKLYIRERKGHTIQPTLLVNEAYLNLVDQDHIDWKGRTHFFAVGAQAIRRVLVQHARSKNAAKRGAGAHKVDLEEGLAFSPERDEIMLSLDEALFRLEEIHQRQAKVVELKFFGGMKMQEIADEIGVSIKTVEIDWRVAKAWLRRFMQNEL